MQWLKLAGNIFSSFCLYIDFDLLLNLCTVIILQKKKKMVYIDTCISLFRDPYYCLIGIGFCGCDIIYGKESDITY
jgi:hypothetical protein